MFTYDQLEEYLDVFIVEAKADLQWLAASGADEFDKDLFDKRVSALEQIKSIVHEYSLLDN